MIGSELFGHVEGSFTGAIKSRRGAIGNADGGILFLDELGELPDYFQAKLLTVMETGKYNTIGSDDEKDSNFRLIAATNKADELREDLRWRFPICLKVPPLADRRIDVFAILDGWLNKKAPNLEWTFEPWVILDILHSSWEGNIRELTNTATLSYERFDFSGGSNKIQFDYKAVDSLGRRYNDDFEESTVELYASVNHFIYHVWTKFAELIRKKPGGDLILKNPYSWAQIYEDYQQKVGDPPTYLTMSETLMLFDFVKRNFEPQPQESLYANGEPHPKFTIPIGCEYFFDIMKPLIAGDYVSRSISDEEASAVEKYLKPLVGNDGFLPKFTKILDGIMPYYLDHQYRTANNNKTKAGSKSGHNAQWFRKKLNEHLNEYIETTENQQ